MSSDRMQRLPQRVVILVLLAGLAAAGCAARAGGAGTALTEDERITAEVVRILQDEEGIVAEDVAVETRAGVVVLSGVQSELEPVSEALRRIARVRGVREVVNRIRIVRGGRAGAPATGSPPATPAPGGGPRAGG